MRQGIINLKKEEKSLRGEQNDRERERYFLIYLKIKPALQLRKDRKIKQGTETSAMWLCFLEPSIIYILCFKAAILKSASGGHTDGSRSYFLGGR